MWILVNLGILFVLGGLKRAVQSLMPQPKPAVPTPFQAPNIPSGTVIPVLYGTQRLPGITTWFGRAQLAQVNELISKTAGFPVYQTFAYNWVLTCMQLYCWGPVTTIRNMVFGGTLSLADQPLTQTLVDPVSGSTLSVSAFPAGYGPVLVTGLEGSVNQQDYQILLPNLYGGTGRGGGLTAVGGDSNNPYGNRLRFYPGALTNDPDSVMGEFLGPDFVPSYGDLCYHIFDRVNVGESSVPPVIDAILFAQPKTENIPSGFGTAIINHRHITGLAWNWQVDDLSAAAILVDLLVNQLYGKGEPLSTITTGTGDSDGLSGSFEDANRALGNEGLGISLVFSGNPSDVGSTVSTILAHIDGVLRKHPVTQQRELKLIRNEASTDLALAGLRSFDESSIQSIDNWGRPDWDDTINAVTVTFSNAEKLFQQDTVTLKNHANFAMTGSWRGTQVQYLGFTDKAVALKACARDLKKLSLRLWRGQVKVDRSAWDVSEGDVIRLTYAPYKLSGMAVRVLATDRGEETNGVITLDVMQDAFSFDDIAFEREPGVVPLTFPKIARPYVSATTQENVLVGGVPTGRLTVTLVDPENRTYEIAYRTIVGAGAPSSWLVTDTATPNTGVTGFPYINPATDTDLSGDHVFEVPLATDGPSAIEYRITAVGYGTAASPDDANIVIDNSVSFVPPGPTVSSLADGSPIIWDVTGKVDDSGSVIISGNRTLLIVGAIPGFRGKLLITSTNATGNVFTLPAESIIDGGGTTVTLGLKDQLSVYFDGTYFWWTHVTSSDTLPAIDLVAPLAAGATFGASLTTRAGLIAPLAAGASLTAALEAFEMLASAMSAGATLAADLTTAPASDPSTILGADLVVWLKRGVGIYTDAGTTLAVSDNDHIYQWNDQSSNAFHYLQTVDTSSWRPRFRTGTTYLGEPVIEHLDAVSGQGFDVPGGVGTALAGASKGEIFLVAKSTQIAGHGPGLWRYSNAGSDAQWPWSDTQVYENWGSTTRYTVGTPPISLSAAFRVVDIYSRNSASGDPDGDTALWRYHLNNSSIFNSASNTVNFITTGIVHGFSSSSHTGASEMMEAEVVIAKRKLTTADRNLMYTYLTT